MSEQSRKVKNPLLTAAGQGFPFEGYSTNALLMPITPAAPAILQDAVSEESPLPKVPESVASSQQGANAEVEFPVAQERPTISQQFETTQQETSDQPGRQSYFTSILSSLPNLSLSSITGDGSTSHTSQSQQSSAGTNPGASRDSTYRGFSQNLYGTPTASGTFVAEDHPRDHSGHYSQAFGDSAFSEASPSSGSPRPPPAVPTLPPSGGPGSYRLGNQRRLKYALPPDLTSNAPKQYPSPESFFTPVQPTSAAGSDFFIPSAVAPPLFSSQSSPGPVSSPNSHVGFGNLHTSHSYTLGSGTAAGSTIQPTASYSAGSSSPLTQSRSAATHQNSSIPDWPRSAEASVSSPREIPSRLPKPATPQNTPVNATFAGFASSYAASQAETSATPSSAVPSKFVEGLTFDVPSAAYARSNALPTHDCIIEPNVVATGHARTTSGLTEDSSFTAISAAKVTAKLEHFLAEREEDSVAATPAFTSSFSESNSKSNSVEQFQQPTSWSAEPNREAVKSEGSEDLADVDLTTNESPADASSIGTNIAGSEVSRGLDFPRTLGSDRLTRAESHSFPSVDINVSSITSIVSDSRNYTSATLPSATNFFGSATDQGKTPATFFPTPNEAPGAFYSPQNFAQSQQRASSFFETGPQISVPESASQYPNVAATNARQNPATGIPQIPTFYDPGEFSTNPRDPLSGFAPRFPTDARISTQSPCPSALSSSPPSFTGGESFVASTMPEPTGSATLNPVQMSVNPGISRSDTVPPSLQSLAAGPADRRMQYRPVYHHWFYRKEVETKVLWLPFSMQDSLSLEEVHNSAEITPETTVATDGGRYDVDILRRRRTPVYWDGNSTEVRRSSWFYKGSTESRYVPYEEGISARLEEEYKQACLTDNWNRRVELNNGEYIVFHSSTVQVHHMPATSPELATSWGNSADSETGAYLQGVASRPKVVKRGVDEFNIDEGEPEKVDHLLFLVHGIGSVCDLKFRTVEEVVDEFRCISLQLVQSHYRTASMHGVVNRIEVLPISWHTTLHSEDTGIDKKLRAITLESIPKLRHFTNDTLLDILFYTSPIYCQTIMQTVGNEMNRLHSLFKERNPNFSGSVYLGGHSLGSLILFDLLCHQKPPVEESKDETDPTPSSADSKGEDDTIDSLKPIGVPVLKRRLSKRISYVMGAAGTGQPFINYPQLSFLPQAFFALGSPIGMFVTVRGIDTLGEDFALPTCPAFFNVFHPFDPVAYRVESLINPEAQKYRPMLIPHHKGRKRMHLELKETMARVGADLKQKLLDSVRSTWNSVYQLAMFHRPENQSFEQEIEKVVEEQLQKSPTVQEHQADDDGGADFRVGQLNGGRRIDYVLQEAPFEYINEYIFALTSHVCYWESEDTMLMILKEIYGGNGIQSDAKLPPQTMTIERVSPSPSIATMSAVSTSYQNSSEASSPVGFDPTAPIANKPVGPPPTSGFVRKL